MLNAWAILCAFIIDSVWFDVSAHVDRAESFRGRLRFDDSEYCREELNMASVTEVADASFENEVLKSEHPVLVDFWAPWCGPCKTIAPVVEELAAEYDGKIKVVKVNVDDNKEAAMKYNVRGIPNLILFKDGEVVEQIVGAVAKQELVSAIDKVV